jgi:hypothetical protein
MIAPFFGCAAIAASIIPFLNGSLQWLEAVAIGMIIVQACDAAIGVTIQDRMKTFGRGGTSIATNDPSDCSHASEKGEQLIDDRRMTKCGRECKSRLGKRPWVPGRRSQCKPEAA